MGPHAMIAFWQYLLFMAGAAALGSVIGWLLNKLPP